MNKVTSHLKLAIALLLAAGIVFAMLRIDFTGASSSRDSEADSEVIPLSLPPKPLSLQSTGAVPSSRATSLGVTV